MVFSATHCGSFVEAEQALDRLAGLDMAPKRIWRAVQRCGTRRLDEWEQTRHAFESLSIPAKRESPPGVAPPEVACVSMDGGRYQRRDRDADCESAAEATSGWREMKVGCLASMTSEISLVDPCPELPATFVDPGQMREIARQIKSFSADTDPTAESDSPHDEPAEAARCDRPGRPQSLRKRVVASAKDVTEFGPLLAAAAYAEGFHAAPRKAFVADGSETNWGVWRKFFSHYTPIVDFVHGLMYVYAAAMADADEEAGWKRYRRWAQLLWNGSIDVLLTEVEARGQELGSPSSDERGTPRTHVAESLRYLTNQRSRMRYDEYRRAGLPITSTMVESTIKQLNRRVKGTEKFWAGGIEPMLTLLADALSDLPLQTSKNAPASPQEPCYRQAA